MPSVNSLLILKDNALKIVDIPSDNIPDTLNGETGFHIYHVRMLTELILRELNNVTDRYKLTEDDIKICQ